jgi:hypothetical protein
MTDQRIVLLSGGLASFEAARRVIQRYGKQDTHLWFFDTLIEDEDLYRFLEDIEDYFAMQIRYFRDGRTPWQVFKEERFIGNSRADVCSKHLKRRLLERELEHAYPHHSDVTLYFGLEWSEPHRIEALAPKWEQKGYAVDFPLTWEPWLFPQDFRKLLGETGITIPRLYDLGFAHNNCGGACIKAGIAQWSLLYRIFPERYHWHEQMEHAVRLSLRKNVSILRDRRGGRTRPMTLRNLRLRLAANRLPGSPFLLSEPVEDSACSCFVNMDDRVQ